LSPDRLIKAELPNPFLLDWRVVVNKRMLRLFLILAVIHCAVFIWYPSTLHSFNDRLAWFGVNAYPWWPLYKLGLPVSYRTFLIRPNPLGWAWCIFVWTMFYLGLAHSLDWILNRDRSRIKHSAG